MKKLDPAYIYHIASLYYNDMLSQNEIAVRENLSRPQVSRILARAKEEGIVKIEVTMPVSSSRDELVRLLKERFGLKEVFVVPSAGKKSLQTAETTQRIIDFSMQAAPIIARLIDNMQYVGLGWGRTVYHIGANLPEIMPAQEHLFIPLAGSHSGIVNHEYQVAAISLAFGSRLHSRSFFLNITKPKSENAELNSYEQFYYEELERYWSMLEAVVCSVGSADYLHEEDKFKFSTADFPVGKTVVGDILYQLYFSDGSSDLSRSQMDMIAIDIQRLKAVPNSILAANGREKIKAIAYALKIGFFNILVTDEATAQDLIDFSFPE